RIGEGRSRTQPVPRRQRYGALGLRDLRLHRTPRALDADQGRTVQALITARRAPDAASLPPSPRPRSLSPAQHLHTHPHRQIIDPSRDTLSRREARFASILHFPLVTAASRLRTGFPAAAG